MDENNNNNRNYVLNTLHSIFLLKLVYIGSYNDLVTIYGN